MTAYAGSALYVQWIYSGGTITLHGDFRNFNYTPTVELYEESAGADPAKLYLAGIKDGQPSMTLVSQAGSVATWGTALKEGTSGTIIAATEGTVAGKPKWTIPAISLGMGVTQPYNNIVDLAISWQQNGERVDGVY